MKKLLGILLVLFSISNNLISLSPNNWNEDYWKQVIDVRKYFDPDTLKGLDSLKKYMSISEFKSCDSMNCMIICNNGIGINVFKSTDGGFNWLSILDYGVFSVFHHLLSVSYPSPEFLIMAFKDDDILRTLDAGNTWDTLATGFDWTLLDMDFNKNGFGAALAYDELLDSVILVYSDDYGNKWSRFESDPPARAKYYLNVLSDSVIVCFGYNYKYNTPPSQYYFFRTENKGKTWEQYSYFNEPIDFLNFIDENIGYGTFSRKGDTTRTEKIIAKTTNGGKDWNIQLDKSFTETSPFLCMSFFDSQRGMALGRYERLLFTSDGGNTWLQDSSFIIKDVRCDMNYLAYTTPERFIIATLDGKVFMYNVGGFASDVKESELLYDNNSKITPNPASDKFEYSISLKHSQFIKIEIFDAIGNKVLPSIERFVEGAEFSTSIDVSSLPIGIYFVVANADNKRIVKKLCKGGF